MPPGVDPLHTAVTTHTLMFNACYDLGRSMDRFVPYVGAGVGTAYDIAEEVYSTGNPRSSTASPATSAGRCHLVADGGRRLARSPSASCWFGHYLRHGRGGMGHVDDARFSNPKVRLDDLAAHDQFGLRFALGAPCCAC